MYGLSDRIQYVFYRSTFALFTLLLILFSAVLPIDSIAQAVESENNAFNTFIVVGALVVFVVICITLLVGRLLYYRSCLVDIPRRYLPITPADLPHDESRAYIMQSMERSKELTVMFNTPKDPVIHSGMEPPRRCDDPHVDKILPEYLDYSAAIKAIRSKFKYSGMLLPASEYRADIECTISDIIYANYINNSHMNTEDVAKAKEFIKIYEYCTFSGKAVTREQFQQFVELYIYFSDLLGNSLSTPQKPPYANSIQDKDSASVIYTQNNAAMVNNSTSSVVNELNNSSTKTGPSNDYTEYFPSGHQNSHGRNTDHRGSTTAEMRSPAYNQVTNDIISELSVAESRNDSCKSVIRR